MAAQQMKSEPPFYPEHDSSSLLHPETKNTEKLIFDWTTVTKNTLKGWVIAANSFAEFVVSGDSKTKDEVTMAFEFGDLRAAGSRGVG